MKKHGAWSIIRQAALRPIRQDLSTRPVDELRSSRSGRVAQGRQAQDKLTADGKKRDAPMRKGDQYG